MVIPLCRLPLPFCLNSYNKLRNQGIDAWVDEWEMLPGASLIDKIFEEGIKNAQAFVIVLSKFSVTKAWVREELNAGIVKRISGQCKVIPVVIDDCEVPEALQSILWEKITDLQNYDTELNRIVSSIYGYSQKPALGPPPKYTKLSINALPGLTQIDTAIFKVICEMSLDLESSLIHTDKLITTCSETGLTDDVIYESLSRSKF